jgi:hypothetical protein
MNKLITNGTLWTGRVTGSLVSVATSTACIYYFLIQIYSEQVLMVSLALFGSLLLETLTVIFLNLFFRNLFILKPVFIVFFLVTIIFYSTTFYLSVNGIKSFIENTQNKTLVYEKSNDINKDSVLNVYNTKINIKQNQLDSLINVTSTWTNRKTLQTKLNYLQLQLTELKTIRDTAISELNKDLKTDIAINNVEVAKIKNEYFYATTGILVFIILMNLLFNILNINKDKLQEVVKKDKTIKEHKNIAKNKKDIQVRLAKKMFKQGCTNKEVIKKTGLNSSDVSRIKNNKLYKNI